MSGTEIFIKKEDNPPVMELKLGELAQEFAKELGISLKPRSLDDVIPDCTYWMTGKNEDYTIDHTLVFNKGNYTAIVEEIKIRKGQEHWETSVVTHMVHSPYTEFFLDYSGHRSQAEKYKAKVYQLSNEIPFVLFEALLAELHIVTDKKYLDREERMRGDLLPPNEDISVTVELNLDDFNVLPKFIKNFYS